MQKSFSLSDLKRRQTAKVVGFSEEIIPNKILEMGLVPGVSVSIKHQAPFKGPICIEYGKEKSNIMLRVDEAQSILIELEK